jgi:hypothetical protein
MVWWFDWELMMCRWAAYLAMRDAVTPDPYEAGGLPL